MARNIFDARDLYIYYPDRTRRMEMLIEHAQARITTLTIRKTSKKGLAAEIEWFDDFDFEQTEIHLNSKLELEKGQCSCGRTYATYLCEHVSALWEYVLSEPWDLPYAYVHPQAHDKDQFFNVFYDERYREKRLKAAQALLEELNQSDAVEIYTKGQEKIRLEFVLPKDPLSPNTPIKLRMGTQKLYIVKDIETEIIEASREGRFIRQGKQQSIQVKREYFDDNSQRIYDFLLQNQHILGRNYFNITNDNLPDFIDLLESQGLASPASSLLNLEVKASKEDTYTVEVTTTEKYTTLRFSHRTLAWQLNDLQIRFTPMSLFDYVTLETFTNNMNRLVFKRSQMTTFLKRVEEQSLIFTIKHLDDTASIEEVVNSPELYLDITDEEVLVVRMAGDISDSLIRDGIHRMMTLFGASIEEDGYYLTSSAAIDRFLESGLDSMHQYGQVFISDALSQYNRPKKFSLKLGVSVSKGLLKLDIDSEDLPVNELMAVLASYRNKKKFHRLKNGERIFLERQQLGEIDQTLAELDLTKVDKKGVILPLYRMYQLEALATDPIATLTYQPSYDKIRQPQTLIADKRLFPILRDYQREGVRWLLQLRAMNFGGILADDMGLGKTIQILNYIETIINTIGEKPILIVTPASLIYNWDHEMDKFESPLERVLILGPADQRTKRIQSAKKNHVPIWLTTYDYLRRDSDIYESIEFDTVILDEAHAIKNHLTKTAQVVKALTTTQRIALTGTPMENTLAELWSIFDFLMPGYLYSYTRFKRIFETPIVSNQDKAKEMRLKKMLDPFILRRMKQEVLEELPEKMEEIYYVAPTEEESKLYQANIVKMAQDLSDTDVKKNSIQVLAFLTRLRQICLDPRLVYDNVNQPSSKLQVALELIDRISKQGEHVLVFSSFKKGLDLLANLCENAGISFAMITGDVAKEARRDIVDRFQAGEVTVLLISLKAGGTGLNLTQASTVIHLDPWWNQSAQNQATDRAYRIGQQQNVQVYQLVMKDTIEEKIEVLKATKQELSDQFIGSSESTNGLTQLSEDEILNLFKPVE